MKIFIIILFFILMFVLLLDIKLDIRKIEIFNKKIKFNIYIQVYLLRKIQLYEKKITKKDILKLIQLSKKRKVFKDEKKIVKSMSIEIEKIDIQLFYNLKNPVHMAYIYGFLQATLNILVTAIKSKYRNIIIKNSYKGNFYIYVNSKIKISIIKTIIKIIKNKIKKIKSKDKRLIQHKA